MTVETGIGVERDEGVLTLCLNRPAKKNAITAAMYQAMADALSAAQVDDSIHVILITGQPQIFTAGNDLEDFLSNPPLLPDSPVFKFMHQMVQATKPIMAAVSGAAVGIGTTLLLHCDIVYASENARFSLPFTQLGLCPEFASSLLLPQIIGHQHAAEKLMLGEMFSVDEAHRMGLVNRVLPAEELPAFAKAQTRKLALLPTRSLRMTKQLMRADNRPAIVARIAAENAAFSQLLQSPEAMNAMKAFFVKPKVDARSNALN